ncbi:MAG TPA: GAF domain-containing protein [Hyphomicrobiales bacterium]|nr:GAF domain-containing protein [Hyphomicrobiales bacterium]
MSPGASASAEGDRAEAERRHERELLEGVVDRVPAMIAVYGADQTILRVNAAFEAVLGWSSAEARGRSLMEECLPDAALRAEVAAFMESGGGGWMDMPMRTRDGRIVETTWANVRLSDGAQVGIGLDITGRKHAEDRLRRQTRRLGALYRLARSVASDLDLERIVQVVTDSATELSGAQFGAFFYNVTDERGEYYTLYTLSGAPREAFANFGLPRNSAVFEPTFRGSGIIRADDIRQDPRYGKSPPHYGMPPGHLPVVSYLAVPVVSRSGAVHGGLFFGHEQPGIFTAEAEEIVAAIAAQAAVALDNAGLLKDAQREVERRREAEQRQQLLLREMDHRIKNLFALAGSVVSLSARTANSPQELAEAVHARLGALARSQALTRAQAPAAAGAPETATTMHALIATILSPYAAADAGTPRTTVEGADIAIGGPAVTAFALLLQEFATNAAKYGALSVPDGRVAVACDEAGDRFRLRWTERGGPPVAPPAEEDGFGTFLARATVEGQLGGTIARDWRPEGLVIRLDVARDRLLPPAGPAD